MGVSTEPCGRLFCWILPLPKNVSKPSDYVAKLFRVSRVSRVLVCAGNLLPAHTNSPNASQPAWSWRQLDFCNVHLYITNCTGQLDRLSHDSDVIQMAHSCHCWFLRVMYPLSCFNVNLYLAISYPWPTHTQGPNPSSNPNSWVWDYELIVGMSWLGYEMARYQLTWVWLDWHPLGTHH